MVRQIAAVIVAARGEAEDFHMPTHLVQEESGKKAILGLGYRTEASCAKDFLHTLPQVQKSTGRAPSP